LFAGCSTNCGKMLIVNNEDAEKKGEKGWEEIGKA